MTDSKEQPDLSELRRRAEAGIEAERVEPESMSPEECVRMIHELRVHQIELEMQNEELRRAQELLAESRDRYTDLYDFAPVGYLTLDRASRIRQANLTAAAMLGVERARLEGRYFTEFFGEADRQGFRKCLAKILQQQQQQFQLLDGHGGARVLLLTLSYDRDAEDKGGCRIAMTDVTELRRVQEELRLHKEELGGLVTERTTELLRANERLQEVNERLEALFQAAPMAIGVFDEQGRVVSINPAAERIFGWSRDEIQGRVVPSIPEERAEESHELLQRVLQGESQLGVEIQQRRRDGALFEAKISAAPIRDREGHVRGFVGLAEDITERKKREEAIQTQVQVLANMAEGVTVTDNCGTILYTNPAFDAMFGYGPGELTGRHSNILNYYPPEENSQMVKDILQSLRATGVWSGEFRNCKKNGSPFFTSARISTLAIGGRKLIISVQEDITERKRWEKEIRRLASFPELIPNPVLEVDTKGRILYANPAVQELVTRLGLSEGARAFLPPDFKEAIAAARLGGPQKHEVDLIIKDRVYTVQLSIPHDLPTVRIYALDITGRKRAEEALQESEHRFRQLVESIPQLVWTCRPDGPCDFLSKQWLDYTGIAEGEQLVYGWLEQIHPDDRERLMQAWKTAIVEGNDFNIEFRIRRHDGVYRWFVTRAAAWTDAAGQIVKWFGTNTDINDRKQAEEELEESEERYRALFQNSHAVMLLIDPATAEIVDANRAAAVYYGYAIDDLRAKKMTEINMLPVDRIRREMKRACAGEARQFFFQHRLASGEIRDVEVFSGPISVHGKKLLYSIVHDITERKRLEAEVAMKAQLLEMSSDSIFVGDLDGNFHYVNEAAYKSLGYSREELLKTHLSDLVTPDQVDQISLWLKILEERGELGFESSHRRKDGSLMPVEVYAKQIRMDGRVIILSSVRDISPRIEAEDALWLSNQRLDLLAGTASQLLASTAPQELINNLCQKLATFLDTEVFLNFLAEADTGRLRLNAYAGITNDQARRIEFIEYGAGVCGSAAKGGRRIEAENIQHSLNPRTNLLKSFGLQAYVCHPLRVEGKVLGTLGFGSRQRSRFTGYELTLMQAVADQVAIALERKRAEEALAVSERRYRELVEMSPDAIVVHQNGRFVYINQAGTQLFGAPEPQILLGRQVRDLVHPDFLEAVKGRANQVYAGIPALLNEEKILRLDGQAVDVETTAVLVKYRGQDAIQVMLRDITRRKEAEAALRDREAKLASILATAPVGIGLLQDRVITEVNQHLCQMSGYTSEELIGQSACFLYPTQEDFDCVGEVQDKKIAQKGIGTVTTCWRRKDGATIDVLMSSAPLDWNNLAAGITVTVLDITEVKQATEALRQERDFSAALLNTLGALVVVMDREGRIVRFNQACEINSGYRFAEVEGRYFFDIFLTPEEKAMVQEGFRRLSAGDFPLNLENHWLSRGGEKRLISWSNTTLTNSDGVVTYVIGTGIDITRQRRAEEALRQAHIELERRVSSRTKQLRQTVDKLINEIAERERAENRLRESEARFAAFMKYLPGSAIMRDRAGRFLFVNEAWEEKLGRQPGASLGKTVDDFWEPAIANRLKALDQEVFDRNKPIEAVVELPMAGEKHTFLSYRFPIRTESGQVEMVGAIGIDITDRLKAEEARDRLIEILEATPDFVGSADWDGRLFYLNRSAREMMGLSQQDDIAAMTYTETMPDWAVEHVLTQGRPIYAREGFWHGESAIRRRDGTEIPVSQVILAHRSQEGRVKFFSTICRDISDRKRAEEKLRKSEEKLRLLNIQLLTAQEDERRRLASELHDELGHALLTLKLHLSSVEQHLLPEQADLKKMMGHIVQYLTDTVEEVRRLYYALSPGDLEDLGLTTALRNMVEDFQELYAEIDWRIEMAEIDDLFPLHIQTLIYRIVQEALTNIGKHAYPEHVKLTVGRETDQVTFIIEDDGCGFSMDEVLDGDKKGMGLAAMAQRVSLAGGIFDLWSRENQGTRIILSIPMNASGERV